MTATHDQYAAFRHKSYRRYFTSRFLTAFSIQVVSTAVGFQIYEQTRDPLWLGMIGLVQFLPSLLLVVFTGLAADKLGRRFVMSSAIIAFGICAALIFTLAVTDSFHPVWVLSILTFFGVARAFHSPASASLAVNLVPKEDFPNAVGWVTSSWQMASIVGPAAGGVLQAISSPLAYGTAAITFAISSVLILSIPKPEQTISKEPTNLETLLGGFRYVWKTKIVLGAITLDLFAVLLGGAVAMLPIYAHDILQIGEIGNGWLRAAPGIGAIITAILITRFPVRDHAGAVLLICVALFGVATALFGASQIVWLSILALALVGAFDMVSVVIREILLQLWTPDEVRGRVNAVNSIFLGASNELGEARAGFMAVKWGAIFTVVSGGIAAVGIAALSAVIFPELRKVRFLDRQDDVK